MSPDWRGRVDADGGRRWHQVIQAPSDKARVVFVGFPSDEGVRRNQGRPGAAAGPAHLRRAMSNLPEVDLALADAGDTTVTGDLEGDLIAHVAELSRWVRPDRLVVGLGGGHEISEASLAFWQEFAPNGHVLNLDAHLDMREESSSTSGTSFRTYLEAGGKNLHAFGISRAANTRPLFNLADQHGVPIVLDTEMDPWQWPAQREKLVSLLNEAEHVYLSLCLDVLEAGSAPGVSAPAGRGLNVAVVDDFVRTVAQSGKCRLFDVAELNPALEIDERTARVAARLIWTMVSEHPFA